MMKSIKSYRREKQRKIKEKCAKMRAAKARYRVKHGENQPQADENKRAMSLLFCDHRTGQVVSFQLYESDRLNKFFIRENEKGWWRDCATTSKVLKYLASSITRTGRFD